MANYLSNALSRLGSFFPMRTTPLEASKKQLLVGDILVDPSKVFSTWATTPYNPDTLVTKQGLKIFDTMKLDEQVKACLAFKKAAVLSPGWEINSPGDEEGDWEPTAFVRSCFEHIPMGWNEVLKYLMLGIDYGYSVTEKVYGEDLKWAKGKLGLKKMISLKPHYIDFRTLPTGELIELTQTNLMGSATDAVGQHIPVDKCVVYTHDKEFENFYGRSELRAAYRAWWTKDNAYKWFAVYLERHGMAPLFALYNQNVYSTDQVDKLKRIVSNIQNATMGVIPRNSPDDIEMWSQQVSAQSRDIFLSALMRTDADIGRALLVPSLIGITSDSNTKGGEQSKGSFARSKTHFDSFIMAVEDVQERVAATVNEQIVKQLCDLNFPDLEDYPLFGFLPMDDEVKLELYDTWAALVAGKVVNRIPDDETHIRNVLGFPENDDPVVEPLPVDKPAPGFDEEGKPFPKPAPIDSDTGKTFHPKPKPVEKKKVTKEMEQFAEDNDGIWVYAGDDIVCVDYNEYAEWDESKHPRDAHGRWDGVERRSGSSSKHGGKRKTDPADLGRPRNWGSTKVGGSLPPAPKVGGKLPKRKGPK